MRVNNIICVAALFAAACGSETAVTPPTPTPETPAESDAIPDDPMSVIPDDVRLWDEFDAKRILKMPDTNTLVVEGIITGAAKDRAQEMEATANEDGWTTETLTTHEGLATLILEKDDRRLKANFTQDGETVGVYLTTRLPE